MTMAMLMVRVLMAHDQALDSTPKTSPVAPRGLWRLWAKTTRSGYRQEMGRPLMTRFMTRLWSVLARSVSAFATTMKLALKP